MAGELAAEWIRIPDGNGNLKKVWLRDSTARRDIAQLQSDIGSLVIPTKTSDLTNDSDFQTGTQVGNAISAEAGLMIPYGYCTTAAATVAKTVTVSPTVTSLETGLTIAVKFQYANTGSNPTLNVNSLGAVAIKRYGTTAAGTSAAANWNANSVVLLTYDGTYWMLVDFNNTTYSGMTDAEYQAGTGTSNRLITPARLKAAIELHAPVQSVNGQTGAVTISVPTKTSDLTNDSGFLTSAPVESVNGQTGVVVLTASDVGAIPSGTTIPTKTSDLTNDSGFITGYTETDPTVPSWAKASTKPTYTAAEVGALPDTTPIPTVPTNVSAFTNDAGYLTSYTETDPTVPSWAKESTKPSYTAAEVGALPDGTLSPVSYSVLSAYSNRCTVDAGGYVKIGNIVFIDITITTANSASTTSFSQFIANESAIKPLKSPQYTVLSAINNTSRTKTTKAFVSSDGGILVCNVAASEVIYITGCYISAS